MTLRSEFGSSPDGDGDWIVRINNESEWDGYMMEDWQAIESHGMTVLPFFGPMSECPSDVLDRQFNTGFGAPSRPTFTVWTSGYVGVPTEYDGSTGITWEPRNPTPYQLKEADE